MIDEGGLLMQHLLEAKVEVDLRKEKRQRDFGERLQEVGQGQEVEILILVHMIKEIKSRVGIVVGVGVWEERVLTKNKRMQSTRNESCYQK